MKRIRTSEPNQNLTHGPSGEKFTSDERGYVTVPDMVAVDMCEAHGCRYASEDETDALMVTEPKPGQFVVTTADGEPVHGGFFTDKGTAELMSRQLKPPSAAATQAAPVTPEVRAEAAKTLSTAAGQEASHENAARDRELATLENSGTVAKGHPTAQPFSGGDPGLTPSPALTPTPPAPTPPAPAASLPGQDATQIKTEPQVPL